MHKRLIIHKNSGLSLLFSDERANWSSLGLRGGRPRMHAQSILSVPWWRFSRLPFQSS